MEVLQQYEYSQIRINQNNTEKYHSSGGGWRYKATKNFWEKRQFFIDIKLHKYLYIFFLFYLFLKHLIIAISLAVIHDGEDDMTEGVAELLAR